MIINVCVYIYIYIYINIGVYPFFSCASPPRPGTPRQECLASGKAMAPELLNLMAQKLHEAKISTAHL